MPKATNKTHFENDHLGAALRWLREHRLSITRRELVTRVKNSGNQVSEVYYHKLENGERQKVSYEKLSPILEVLHSSVSELSGLCRTKPWDAAQNKSWRPTSQTTAPKEFTEATTKALASQDWTEESDESQALQGETTELVEHFVRLPQAKRKKLLAAARNARYGK